MLENPYSVSLEPRLLSATPIERVVMLYDGAISAIQDAREHLANRRIAERSQAVSLAVEILAELTQSLDHSAGGELSGKLAALYDYAQRRLLDANFRQADDGLAEAEQLLATVREGWAGAAEAAEAVETAQSVELETQPVADFAWGVPAQETPVAHQWSA